MALSHLRRLALAGVAAVAAAAQTQTAAPPCKIQPPVRPAPSPAEIISGDRLPGLWRDLGIPGTLKAGTRKFGGQPEEIDCAEGCKADIIVSGPLLAEGDESVVRVCDQLVHTCRFLLLHQSPSGWNLLDYIDSAFQKYEAPTLKVEAWHDKRWLVRRGFGGGGTGVYLAVSDWFEFQCGALHQLITVPSDGYDVDASPARYFSTRFRTMEKAGNRESLEFGFVVLFQEYSFRAETPGRKLWQEERTVVFSRSDPNSGFVFDPVRSGISAKWMDKVFVFDTMDENDFVDFAYDHLARIASEPGDSRRDWLRDYLSQMTETPRVKALEALLNRPIKPPTPRSRP